MEKNVNEIKTEVKEFVESMKLTPEEVAALPKAKCQIQKVITKKGARLFTLTVKFVNEFGVDYKKQSYIDEAQYNHFLRHHPKLDVKSGTYVVDLPVRFVKGIGKNGLEYFAYQVWISEKIVINTFMKYFDRTELDDIGYKVNWEIRPDAIDIETAEF